MDDEVEDVVGDVKLTDSQKSVTVSNIQSVDFTDSSSEKHNSSGMDTYVLEWDSDESESSALRGNLSIVSMKDKPAKPILINRHAQCEVTRKFNRASSTGVGKCSVFAQEIFTQTSKTIIELAEMDGAIKRPVVSNTLDTQTSFLSITEDKTVEYRIEVSGSTQNVTKNEMISGSIDNSYGMPFHQIFPNSLDDGSSKFMVSESENDCASDSSSTTNPKEYSPSPENTDSKENILLYENQNEYENTSDFAPSADTTDIEEDSLMEPKRKVNNKCVIRSDGSRTPSSVDDDVAELYTKLSETLDFHMPTPSEHEKKRFGYLTPLTEESIVRKESSGDVPTAAPAIATNQNEDPDKDVLFTNNAGIKVKLFPKDNSNESQIFKLPPIQGNSCPENLNFLFTSNSNKSVNKTGNLPCVYEERKDRSLDRWDLGGNNLGAGESALIGGTSESDRPHSSVQLPPIHVEGCVTRNSNKTDHHAFNVNKIENPSDLLCPISIKDKIRELKLSHRPRGSWSQSRYWNVSESKSDSPSSGISPDRLTDATERGCELICVELSKRLRSTSWFEISDVLDDLPRLLDKFWGVMAEHRIADLIRQVTAQIESPRTQVARAACNALATILKNTNYTKKPDFYEAMTILLIKTGSFSRPVRRAANVALDDIVCSVDLSHSVTALCIHGSNHKSPLVRCASARLLVVCCALGGGGRELLRTRPPSAACARKHALRSLAALLDDKSTDARKYAERLYSMLRPLSNFEAYYLTDVDVDLASRQMKKYDHLLLCGPQETR